MKQSGSAPGGALGLTGAMVTFLVEDTMEEEDGSRLRRGDEVRFKVQFGAGSKNNKGTVDVTYLLKSCCPVPPTHCPCFITGILLPPVRCVRLFNYRKLIS